MRPITSFVLIVVVAGVAAAQVTTTTTTATTSSTPVTVYENSVSVMDSIGNLVVIDSGSTYTPTMTGIGRPSRPATPMTRITVIQPGGSPMTQVYNARVQLVGAGQLAVYAVATYSVTSGSTTTQSQDLIAINPQSTLPTAISGYPSWSITTGAQVQLDTADMKNDYISIVGLLGPQSSNATTTTQRNAVVVQFNGESFVQVSSATLP